jgi:hypothetical protein
MYVVARRFQAVGRSLDAFKFGERQYLPKTVDVTMKEAERVFSVAVEAERAGAAADHGEHLAKAERLVKVVAFLVSREAPKFTADPEAWITARWDADEVDRAKRESRLAHLRERAVALKLIRNGNPQWVCPDIAAADPVIQRALKKVGYTSDRLRAEQSLKRMGQS